MKVLCNKRKSQQGAIYIEYIFTIPLVLFGVFFFIWIGFIFNAKSAFTTSIYRSLKLGATRAQALDQGGVHLIPEVGDWLASPSGTSPVGFGRLGQLLAHGVDWTDAIEYYKADGLNPDPNKPDRPVGWVFDSDLHDMPAQYTYALIYAYQAMQISIGDTVRYPCNPDLNSKEASGCLRCIYVNPDSDPPGDIYSQADDDAPVGNYGFHCRFQPSHTFLNPIITALSILTGDIDRPLVVFERKFFFQFSLGGEDA